MTLVQLPKLCDLKHFFRFCSSSGVTEDREKRAALAETSRRKRWNMFYSNKDASVLCQGAEEEMNERSFIHTQVSRFCRLAKVGGSRWGWREAGGFHAAPDQRARKAPSGSDSSPFSCFLGLSVSISAPGTLQGLKTAFVTADGSVLPKNSCFTSSYTAWTIRGSLAYLEKDKNKLSTKIPWWSNRYEQRLWGLFWFWKMEENLFSPWQESVFSETAASVANKRIFCQSAVPH